MKFLITENKLEQIVFKYLDNQDFIQIKKNDRIYFANSESDEYAQIRYDEKDGWCGIYYELVDEISHFFSIKSDSEPIIGRWVENTLQMKVTDTSESFNVNTFWLRIPNK